LRQAAVVSVPPGRGGCTAEEEKTIAGKWDGRPSISNSVVDAGKKIQIQLEPKASP